MSAVLISVFAASLLGSLHCAGMCGGIVAFATAGDRPRRSLPVLQPERMVTHLAYHAGRLLSYAALGAMAGAVGSALNLAGSLAGLSQVAAWSAGIVIVVWALASLLPRRLLPRWSTDSSVFSAAVRRASELPPSTRAAILGLSTGLLPCGWLYAFVVVAAGTGSSLEGAAILSAFWLGSVPILIGVGSLAQLLSASVRRRLPILSALLLLCVGAGNLWLRTDLDPLDLLSNVTATAPSVAGESAADDASTACH